MAAPRRRQERLARATAAAKAGAAPRRRHHVAGIWHVRGQALARFVWPAHTRRLPRGKAVLVLLLNIFPLPGLGTVLYGKWERGLAQFLLTFLFLIGWVWAILDGARIVTTAYRSPPPTAPVY